MKADEFPLPKLLDLLKAKGVRTFTDGGLHIEFAPTEQTPMTSTPIPEDPACKCGHPYHQHNEVGLCLIGCEPDACAAPPK